MQTTISEAEIYRNHVRRIAIGLSVVCNIPSGEHLVIMIGSGSESSNQKALEYWVTQHLELSEAECLKSTLDKLKSLLIDEIESWQQY